MPAYTQEYARLDLCSLTPEQHARTCGYWYTVTDASTPHTAFRTREELLAWIGARGLTVDAEAIPRAGTFSYQKIGGKYRTAMHAGARATDESVLRWIGGYDEFYALEGEHIRVMSNGQVTLGIVTADDDGVRTVHVLNPNMTYRPVYERE